LKLWLWFFLIPWQGFNKIKYVFDRIPKAQFSHYMKPCSRVTLKKCFKCFLSTYKSYANSLWPYGCGWGIPESTLHLLLPLSYSIYGRDLSIYELGKPSRANRIDIPKLGIASTFYYSLFHIITSISIVFIDSTRASPLQFSIWPSKNISHIQVLVFSQTFLQPHP
jgi:hypothetical protein